jgi:hypothetical protein
MCTPAAGGYELEEFKQSNDTLPRCQGSGFFVKKRDKTPD